MPILSGSSWFLLGAGVLHALFTLYELFPWSLPLLLRIVIKKSPDIEAFTPAQQTLVATIVQNAGIYNAIVAGGLFWAAFGGASLTNVAHLLLAGAAVAGIFGTITLKSPITAIQALVGIIGFFLV